MMPTKGQELNAVERIGKNQMESINKIGCKWNINASGDYIILDVHHSNFRPGTSKGTAPEFRKIMQLKNGTRYIRHDKKNWAID